MTPRAIAQRVRVLGRHFLDHQFERDSPLPALSPPLLEAVYSHEIVLPPRKYLEQAGGQTLEGLVFLAGLVRAIEATSAFEIGTFTGVTTWTLAGNMGSGVVRTLDLPPESQPALALEDSDREIRGLFSGQVYDERPHPAEIEQHWGDSASFDFSPWKDRCDLVYIDGAHSEPYVERDTRSAIEMLSPRGAIVWDDYWRHVEGVPKVLNRMTSMQLRRIPGTRLVVYLAPAAESRLRESTTRQRAADEPGIDSGDQ
ncbi:MAG: class I SAM-dependent methyltransferase [Actinomycetota bacterium]